MDDIRKNSVTANDVGNANNSGVFYWMLNCQPGNKTGLPPYWSPARDYYLRQVVTTPFHDFWVGALGIAVTKATSMSWDIEGDAPRLRSYMQDLLLNADGTGWDTFLARHLQDFLCTDNGAFIEIVRSSSAAGSRILGLMHLDSLRCTRTGDPDYPVIYHDTKGVDHAMKQHQVMMLVDMPSPAETWHGVGLCAESRAYDAIKKLEAIERYFYDKVSGTRALAIDLVGGVDETKIRTSMDAAKEDNEGRRGNYLYMGAVLVPTLSDVPITHTRINLAELPDGFDYEKQFNNCALTYANAIGLDVQDLQPLTGRPLGSGQQSEVLDAKSKGKGLAAWRQQLPHQLNEWVTPSAVVFAFSENDLRDQKQVADVTNTYAGAAKTMVDGGIIDADQAKQILADAKVLPKEFVPVDTTPRESLSDAEKPEVEAAAQEGTPVTPEIKEASDDADAPFHREEYIKRIQEIQERATRFSDGGVL